MRKDVGPVLTVWMKECLPVEWVCARKNGIIFGLDMSGEMHMRRRSEVFGCIPHGRGAYRFQPCRLCRSKQGEATISISSDPFVL